MTADERINAAIQDRKAERTAVEGKLTRLEPRRVYIDGEWDRVERAFADAVRKSGITPESRLRVAAEMEAVSLDRLRLYRELAEVNSRKLELTADLYRIESDIRELEMEQASLYWQSAVSEEGHPLSNTTDETR